MDKLERIYQAQVQVKDRFQDLETLLERAKKENTEVQIILETDTESDMEDAFKRLTETVPRSVVIAGS